MKKLLLFLVLFFILLGSIAYLWFHRVTKEIFVASTPVKPAVNLPTSIQGYMDTKTPFNILVAGYGGGKHDGAYLTDTMILAHIDPKNQKVFLVSIPRDIWVKIPTEGENGKYWKINAAYALGIDDQQFPNKLPLYKGTDGGGRLVEHVLGQVLGVDIPYFVGLDFSGFTNTIDTLGGVDINVRPAFTDEEYPLEGKEADLCGHQPEEIPALDQEAATTSAALVYPCRYEKLHFDAGVQHMDGGSALKYVRSRHSKEDGSDFGRALRQQKLILAVKQKILSAGFISRAIPFLNSLGGDFKTDLTPSDVKTLAEHVSEINGYSITALALTDQNYLMESLTDSGQNILMSIDGLDNWKSVHTWLTNTFSGLPVPILPVVQVLNGTKAPGLAQHATDRVKELHFQIRNPASTKDHNIEKTMITVFDPAIPTSALSTLFKEFNVRALSAPTSATPSGVNVVITLGTDYQPVISTSPQPTP